MMAAGSSGNKNFGMTLVELLVVIAILSVLLAIAIPSYQSYAAKEKVTEAYMALEEYKIRTIKVTALYGAPSISIPWPVVSGVATNNTDYILYPDGDLAGTSATLGSTSKTLTPSLNYVDQISAFVIGDAVLLGARLKTSGNIITATHNYVYIAYVTNGTNGYQWVCGTSTSMGNNIDPSLLPSSCSAALP